MNQEEKKWLLENKYRRLILENIGKTGKTEKEIIEELEIKLMPYLSDYQPTARIKMTPSSLKNHLSLLLREGLVEKKAGKFYQKLEKM